MHSQSFYETPARKREFRVHHNGDWSGDMVIIDTAPENRRAREAMSPSACPEIRIPLSVMREIVAKADAENSAALREAGEIVGIQEETIEDIIENLDTPDPTPRSRVYRANRSRHENKGIARACKLVMRDACERLKDCDDQGAILLRDTALKIEALKETTQ